jgi:hypothetical protein
MTVQKRGWSIRIVDESNVDILCGVDLDQAKANAEFIIQACNAYDADQAEIKRLRDALEKASMELNFIKFDGRHDSKLCRTRAAQQQMSPCLLCEIEQLFK